MQLLPNFIKMNYEKETHADMGPHHEIASEKWTHDVSPKTQRQSFEVTSKGGGLKINPAKLVFTGIIK